MSFISADEIRTKFSRAMSEMYKQEVPAYGTLLDIVKEVNQQTLDKNPALKAKLEAVGNLDRITEERHGAIRLGKPEELATIRKVFAVMGMEPVGYYDLSIAGVPVHSTAFRPVSDESLRKNPFRVFTSLLRMEQIEDESLRAEAQAILDKRDIFTPRLRELLAQKEQKGGLTEAEADEFVAEATKTFQWHKNATVNKDVYDRLHKVHPLIADIVCFKGPHINHLTPNTLDIDEVQRLMPLRGIDPKAVIEGPARNDALVLLRQTSFKALQEPIAFLDVQGNHRARFGEIEQRGIALKPAGRQTYDKTLADVLATVKPAGDGSNKEEYMRVLNEKFGAAFPKDYDTLRKDNAAFFEYYVTPEGKAAKGSIQRIATLDDLIRKGYVSFAPVIYEDFLPVSAAGIFQSNLGDDARQKEMAVSNQAAFEACLGQKPHDAFELYNGKEQRSIEKVFKDLSIEQKKTNLVAGAVSSKLRGDNFWQAVEDRNQAIRDKHKQGVAHTLQ